jgi:hypothetical protein
MTQQEIEKAFSKRNLFVGRMISAHKISPKGEFCVWNANVIAESSGKVWFGDLNITKDATKLKEVAIEIGEKLFVLREMDARFETESDPIDVLISRAVWDTTKD